MEIKLTWHLLVMIIVTVILVINIFRERDGLDMSSGLFFILLVVVWLIYGGVFLW